MNKGLSRAVMATACLFIASASQAASFSAFLDHTNKMRWLPSGEDYLKVTVSEDAAGDVRFLVETLEPLQDMAVRKRRDFGLQSFSFNFGESGARLGNIELPDDWRLGAEGGRAFGTFDATLKTNRFNRTNVLEFAISGVDGDEPIDYLRNLSLGDAKVGNYLFAAQVGGLIKGGRGEKCRGDDCWGGKSRARTVKFAGGSVVPIPAAVWLFGSGLLGLLGLRGRGQAK